MNRPFRRRQSAGRNSETDHYWRRPTHYPYGMGVGAQVMRVAELQGHGSGTFLSRNVARQPVASSVIMFQN